MKMCERNEFEETLRSVKESCLHILNDVSSRDILLAATRIYLEERREQMNCEE